MISVFVCDEASYIDRLAGLIENIFSGLMTEAEIKSFSSPGECLREVRRSAKPPDVAFLEIEMRAASGFELAREIKKEGGETLVVFVSGNPELVFDCFDCHPFSFVRKSGDEMFFRELKKACGDIAAFFNHKKLVEIQNVYTGKEYVSANDILFVEKDNHYLVWSLWRDGRPVKERGTMQNAIEKLKDFRFIRPHVSYLVNASHIRSFSTKFKNIVLDSGDKIPVSRSMKDNAFREYTDYLRSH